MIQEAFKKYYAREPEWVARAPGRVNLIGEHTDYNDGFVLPLAIDRYTTVAAAPSDSSVITLRSTTIDKVVRIDLSTPLEPGPRACWSNYPHGVIAGFMEMGCQIPGFDALIESTVPLGGGLSSSAALEVATATLLEAITGLTLDPVEKALLCQRAEHHYAGVPCGIMDQFVSTLGRKNHLLLLDCRTKTPEWIPFADRDVSILIINTNVRHQLAGSEYALRREQCRTAARSLGVRSLRDATPEQLEHERSRMDPMIYRRARHVVREIDRTTSAATAIRRSDWLAVGTLMYSSHDSLAKDYEVSCAELDAAVEIMQNIGPRGGVYGCRMTGGGFGGCAVALILSSKGESIAGTVAHEYKAMTGIDPTIMVSHPAQGASVLKPARESAEQTTTAHKCERARALEAEPA